MFLWDSANGYIVASRVVSPTLMAEAPVSLIQGGYIKDIKLRDTPNYQFACSGSSKLILWSLEPQTGNLEETVVPTGAYVRNYISLCFSKPNQEYLFAGTQSGDFTCFQLKHKLIVFVQNVCAMGVTQIVCVSEDKVAVGGGDGTLALFHVEGKFCQELLKTQLAGSISGLTVSPDGVQLLASTDRGFIYRVRISDFSSMLLGENHISAVLDNSYMEGSSDKFATSSEDGTIRLWDANDYSVYARIAQVPTGYPTCTLFTDEIIISGWSDGKVRAFRVDNQELLWTIDHAHPSGVTAIELAHNFKFLATGGNDGEIRVWEIRTRELISHLKEHTSKITKIEIFPDDVHLMSSSRDKSVLTWDLKNEKRLSNHTQSMGGINCFARNPLDGSKFITVGQERQITFWDMNKQTPDAIMNSSPQPHESDELFSLAMSPDGKHFVTGGSLGVVRMWDYASGKCVSE